MVVCVLAITPNCVCCIERQCLGAHVHSCVCCIVGLHVWLHCVVSGIIHVTVHFGVSHGCVFWDPTELCIGVGDPRMAGLHLTEIWGAGPPILHVLKQTQNRGQVLRLCSGRRNLPSLALVAHEHCAQSTLGESDRSLCSRLGGGSL